MGSRPDKMTILQTVPTEYEAAMLVARLDSDGIDAWTEGGLASGYRAEAPGSANVMVRQQDLARAVSLLRESRGEPAPPPSGRVLVYGVHSLLTGAPQLLHTENAVSFQQPGAVDPRQLTARPAHVLVGDTFALHGLHLQGDATEVRVRGPGWDAALLLPNIRYRASAEGERIDVTVDALAEGRTVVPGLYSVRVTTTETRPLAGGGTRDYRRVSNAADPTDFRLARPDPPDPDDPEGCLGRRYSGPLGPPCAVPSNAKDS